MRLLSQASEAPLRDRCRENTSFKNAADLHPVAEFCVVKIVIVGTGKSRRRLNDIKKAVELLPIAAKAIGDDLGKIGVVIVIINYGRRPDHLTPADYADFVFFEYYSLDRATSAKVVKFRFPGLGYAPAAIAADKINRPETAVGDYALADIARQGCDSSLEIGRARDRDRYLFDSGLPHFDASRREFDAVD